MYRTLTTTVPATDALTGKIIPVTLTVPMDLPTEARADYLRKLWSEHVQYGQKNVAEMAARGIAYTPDPKGPCYANVPADIADDVAEAMDFMGAIVDDRRPITDGSGRIALFSRGYRAHGF